MVRSAWGWQMEEFPTKNYVSWRIQYRGRGLWKGERLTAGKRDVAVAETQTQVGFHLDIKPCHFCFPLLFILPSSPLRI